jgi:hypothetical protein
VAEIYLNKLASAARLIDAAIRMHKSGEDQLAVYVVASAGYRVLRDIREQRGNSHYAEGFQMGLFYMARDFLRGTLPSNLPAEHPELMTTVEQVAQLMKTGVVETFSDIRVSTSRRAEREHWQRINKPYNFLKHADQDADGLLGLDSIDVELPITGASAIYKQITGDLTDYMRDFAHSFASS